MTQGKGLEGAGERGRPWSAWEWQGALGRGTAHGPEAGQLDMPTESQEGTVAGAQRTERTGEISKGGGLEPGLITCSGARHCVRQAVCKGTPQESSLEDRVGLGFQVPLKGLKPHPAA